MSRKRGLTPEDRELWSRIARTVIPRSDKRLEAPASAAPKPVAKQPRPVQYPEISTDFRIGSKSSPQSRFVPAPSPAEALAAHPVRMDHRTHKQMTKGKLRPQARLDLHGMTLAEAGPELTHFIMSCHARGLRLVLVITGKGSRSGDIGPLPTRPGALRHQVPHWLHSPPLSRVVQQVSTAHLRHGGSGAYYVYLRRLV